MGELWRRLWYFLQRDRAARELEEEMRIHVEMRAAKVRASGPVADLRNDAAYQTARRKFGNTTHIQQRSQSMWGLTSVDDLTNDVRFALRRLRQRPAFTAAVVGVMAIGIGATTAMFSAVDAAWLRPLPFHEPTMLVALPKVTVPFELDVQDAAAPHALTMLEARDRRDLFSHVAAYSSGGMNIPDATRPIRVNAALVSTEFFQTLGVLPAAGRAFSPGDATPGAGKVAVISHGLWQRQYGSRDIADLAISIGKQSFQVAGVMPLGMNFPNRSDVWLLMSVPNTMADLRILSIESASTNVIARVAPGLSPSYASAQLLAQWERNRGPSSSAQFASLGNEVAALRMSGAAVSLQDFLVGDQRKPLFVLLGATGLLLLIACVNVTNLLLSHAVSRQREIAVRQVLGATRLRILRQLLTESLILSASGALLGLMFAPAMLGTMQVLMPRNLAGVAPAAIDLRVLVFTALLAVLTGVAFGLWPALGSTKSDASDVIKKGGGHGATFSRGRSTRRILVGAELALTVMLLIGAGLMVRSFQQLMSRDSGLQAENVGTLELSITSSGGGSADRLRKFDEIIAELTAVPGVTAAGIVNKLPLGGRGTMSIRLKVNGARAETGDPLNSMVRYLQASSGYFASMGIRLLQGRLPSASDDSLAPPVVVINAAMARHYWPNRSAVGGTFQWPGSKAPVTVVGVVSDVRDNRLEDAATMQMFFPIHAHTPTSLAVVARGSLPDDILLRRMSEAVRKVDATQAIMSLRMMDDVISTSVAPRRTNTVLISAFAILALMLASVGVYAVVSHGVAQRSREFGIRSALGATGASLMKMISQEMAWVCAVGAAVGLSGAWILARTFESLVYGVAVHDRVTFLVVPVALLVPVILATAVPARRAMRVNAADVMRAD